MKWQNAIDGYLNTQKKYLVVEPAYFEETSEIYRDLAKNNSKIHSWGIVDIGKIQKEKNIEINSNSLASEVTTTNELARVYVNYLLGRVMKCESIEDLRKNAIAILPDCMLYQGYVLRKINPAFYKYPIIGKEALKRQKQLKEMELNQLKEKIVREDNIIAVMQNVKQMDNFSEDDVINFKDYVEKSKNKGKYLSEKGDLQKELDGMDFFWLDNINDKINQKREENSEKEEKIKNNSEKIVSLRMQIKITINEKIPNLKEQLDKKCLQIDESYDEEWQKSKGEEKFAIQLLKRTPEKMIEVYSHHIKNTTHRKEQINVMLMDKKSNYNTKYQMSYSIHEGSNQQFSEELRKLKEIELPQQLERIEDSRKKAYEQFRIEFLDKLKSNIDEVRLQIKELNQALEEHYFGTDTYRFTVTPKQEYRKIYDMLQDELLLGDWGIGQEQFNQKYAQEIKDLFVKISTGVTGSLLAEEEYEKEYTDYRTYLNFDLIVKDKTGNAQRLSKTLLKKSGGETQTPFYISILASFAQVYRIKNQDNTLRLILFDEAFSKMDSERIEESIKLLRKIGFQAVFAAPPEKLQDIEKLVDSTLLVLNLEDHEIVVKEYKKMKSSGLE